MNPTTNQGNDSSGSFSMLEKSVHAALETYSNVHRGSGFNSMVSTRLYENARSVVLEYLGLSKATYTVIFCSTRQAGMLESQIGPKSFKRISSRDIGLPLGVTAMAVKRNALPKGTPFQTGGGNARLIAGDWVIWAAAPQRFETGTPAIINVIAFARALQMVRAGEMFLTDPAEGTINPKDMLYQDELVGLSGHELLDKLRQTLIGKDKMVPTAAGEKPFVNLDSSASTQTFTPVWNVVRKIWQQPQHIQQQAIDEVRQICADFLGAPASEYDIIFTSNATEAINLAAESFGLESNDGIEPVVLNTFLEHSSNELPWRLNSKAELIRLPVDKEGFMDLPEMERLLKTYNLDGGSGNKRIKLVAVSGASNVLGTFNDLQAISKIVHEYGARLLVDAAQLVAHRSVGMEEWGIDYLAFSAHKIYAPFGSGVLAVRKGLLEFSPAEMDSIRLSGEQNAVGIAALGKALLLIKRIGFDVIQKDEQALTARVIRGLSPITGMSVYGINDPDSPNFDFKGGVIPFNLKQVIAFKMSKELSLRGGIGVRGGCHCAHLLVKRTLNVSPGLEKFQRVIITLFKKLSLPGLVRVSIGLTTTEEEVDRLISVMHEIAAKTPIRSEAALKKQTGDFVEASVRKVFS